MIYAGTTKTHEPHLASKVSFTKSHQRLHDLSPIIDAKTPDNEPLLPQGQCACQVLGIYKVCMRMPSRWIVIPLIALQAPTNLNLGIEKAW